MAKHSDEKRTDRITMKISPSVKTLAQAMAMEDGRSLSNYIEWLIIKDAKEKGMEMNKQ